MDKPLLDIYADYLISSFGPTTATGLSRLLQAHLSHDKITRFLSEKPYTSANLWQVVKPLVRQVQNGNAVLVMDDGIAHKPHTDPSELIGWHYDHTTGTSVKGINFLTTLYCTAEVSLPVAFALVEKNEVFTDKKTGQTKRRATVSKNAYYQERWQVEVYHKLLKQNASLACSPTRTKTTQSIHVFLSLCAYVKLETPKMRTKCSHFALKQKLYVAALQAAFSQWQTLQPNNLRMSA